MLYRGIRCDDVIRRGTRLTSLEDIFLEDRKDSKKNRATNLSYCGRQSGLLFVMFQEVFEKCAKNNDTKSEENRKQASIFIMSIFGYKQSLTIIVIIKVIISVHTRLLCM